MTKYPVPLIIIMCMLGVGSRRGTGPPPAHIRQEEVSEVRIHLWPEYAGIRRAVVVPGKGSGLPPVMLQEATRQALRERIATVVDIIHLGRLALPFPDGT